MSGVVPPWRVGVIGDGLHLSSRLSQPLSSGSWTSGIEGHGPYESRIEPQDGDGSCVTAEEACSGCLTLFEPGDFLQVMPAWNSQAQGKLAERRSMFQPPLLIGTYRQPLIGQSWSLPGHPPENSNHWRRITALGGRVSVSAGGDGPGCGHKRPAMSPSPPC